ncbi:MAG: thiol-disulfide oxidoreductase DCC family protein [Vulcanimicrobiaceae bacterium]
MSHSIVLFDGLCNFCDGAVRFMIANDRRARLRFTSSQSAAASDLLARFGRPAGSPGSIVLIEGDRYFDGSDAALRIAGMLDPPWSFARAFLAVPRPLREAAYGAVARNRYRLFGRRDACRIPSPNERERFV